MIFRNSRYQNALIDYFALNTNEDVHPVLFYQIPDIGTINYFEYEWIDGDRLDSVALAFYGSSDLWWIILDNNPQIKDPNNIPPGTVLRIESLR